MADEKSELEDNYETASNQYYAKNLVGKLLLIHGEEPQDRQTDRQTDNKGPPPLAASR